MTFYYVTIEKENGWKMLDRIFNEFNPAKGYTEYLIKQYQSDYTINLRKTGNFGDVFASEEYTIIKCKGTYKKEGRQ